jgi:hypothetical protein
MKTLTALLLSTLFAAAVLAAPSKPNFTGSWELNTQKSDLGGAPITRISVQIDHKDPAFKYTAKGTVNGEEFEESGTIMTDGTPTQDSRGATVKGHWDGATLVVESTSADGSLLDEARMSLSSDGKTIVRDYENKSDPQKRHEIWDKQ